MINSKKTLIMCALSMIMLFGISSMAFALPDIQNVVLSGDILSWDALEGTATYYIGIGSGGGFIDNVTSYNLKEMASSFGFVSGVYTYHLNARDADRNVISNDHTGQYNYVSDYEQLATPQNCRWDNYVAKWDAVDGAENYYVYFYEENNNIASMTINTTYTYIDMSTDNRLASDKRYYFQVEACATDAIDSELGESPLEYGWFELKDMENVVLNGDILSWDPVEGADHYYLGLGPAGGPIDNVTSINLREFAEKFDFDEGEKTIRLKARDANSNDITHLYTGSYEYIIISYDLWVNGEKFSEENTTIDCGEGSATFDAKTKTLTLTNATITGCSSYNDSGYYSGIASKIKTITIKLVGNNFITPTNFDADGIGTAPGCDIIIEGTGTLTIENSYYGTYIGSYEKDGGNLTINNATLNVINTTCAGIWVNNDIEIVNSKVNVNRTSGNYNGIVANKYGQITIENSEVKVNNKRSAILLGNGENGENVLMFKSGKLIITTDDTGIYCQPFMEDESIIEARIIIESKSAYLEVNSGIAGTNIPDGQIVLQGDSAYTKGESLSESGEVIINSNAMQGDLDEDGDISIVDVRLLLQKFIDSNSSTLFSQSELDVMDLDGDELITITDVRLLLQMFIDS